MQSDAHVAQVVPAGNVKTFATAFPCLTIRFDCVIDPWIKFSWLRCLKYERHSIDAANQENTQRTLIPLLRSLPS